LPSSDEKEFQSFGEIHVQRNVDLIFPRLPDTIIFVVAKEPAGFGKVEA
jgi:hypothetical protein